MGVPHLLSIYLRDHHAGAVIGAGVARRLVGSNEDTAYGRELTRLAAEIEEDRRTLESLMEKMGVSRDQVKDVVAAAGERLGRLKRNGRWLSYSPLSRLLELEGLALGVGGKLLLWQSLREVLGDSLAGVDLSELEARAEGQRQRIEELRLRAATEALRSD